MIKLITIKRNDNNFFIKTHKRYNKNLNLEDVNNMEREREEEKRATEDELLHHFKEITKSMIQLSLKMS